MIEATCGACGTLNRVADNEVPAGAKFVTCTSCKARVPIPSKTLHNAPSIPKIPSVIPSIPKVPVPAAKSDVIDLADLPAPKRAAPLGSEPSRAAPRSGLAAALHTDADLPAPKMSEQEPMNLDDLMGDAEPVLAEPKASFADLPAPKHAAPAPPPRRVVGDLPTPKVAASRAPVRGEVDLPAPKASGNVMDLPAPKPFADLPAPKGSAGPGFSDLPAPKHGGVSDLLAPKNGAMAGFSDLPVPKYGGSDRGLGDLPTPKNGPASGFSDLPAPKPGGITDLPQPRYGTVDAPARFGSVDLPTPKDATDLPAPVNAELPAPKGFFDDLPQPSRGGPGLPAPKGFFDDLPQAAKQRPEVPAPKGFFDDLPQHQKNRAEPPAPKGFFDDLPQAKRGNTTEPPAPKGFFDDLPQPSGGAPTHPRAHRPSDSEHLDLGDLDAPGGDLDLGLPEPSGRGSQLRLDTEPPVVTMKPSSSPPPTPMAMPPQPPAAAMVSSARSADLSLELEDAPPSKKQKKTPAPVKHKALKGKTATRASLSRSRKMLIGTLLALVVGGAGFLMYQRHAKAVEREETIDSGLQAARASLVAPAAGHWRQAQAAVQRVLAEDPENRDALALGAEAQLAGALDTGLDGNLVSGRGMLTKAVAANASPAQLARAQGLAAIASNQPDRAVELLKPIAAAAPKDGFAQLYYGWAQSEAHNLAEAVKAFDAAVGVPATKISGLYARGRARLDGGDLEGARTDFIAVYEADKNHIGAQVGIAAAAPATKAAQRESDLLAILARKDIKSADPRAVAQAWTLAADDARRAGRLDSARDRYRKALAVVDKDLSAMTGLAELEVRDNKLDAASEVATKALTQAPSYVPALLVMAEIEIRTKRMPEAAKRLDELDKRTPRLSNPERARWSLVQGKLLEAMDRPDEAIDAYVQAAKLASDTDLAPRMAAVTTLMSMSHKAQISRDPHKAQVLSQQADSVLGNLPELAKTDPNVALTLGAAYLEADNAPRAEPWLRHATELRPDDLGALFQLAKALAKLNRFDEAIAQLKRAASSDPNRADIQLELARTYEAAERTDEAGKLYDKILAGKDISIEARGWAGRYYVRKGNIAKGAEQGEEIRQVDPANPAGLFLRGYGQLAQGAADPAAKAFKRATELDPDPEYFDAWGLAAEAQAIQSKDPRFEEVALKAYQSAHDLAPRLVNPLAGEGRIYLNRKDPNHAIQPLIDASKLKPDDPDIAYDIGAAYQDLQQNPVAIKWLERAGILKPRAETFWRLGQLYSDGAHDKDAFKNLALATRLGTQEAKDTGKEVDWLTEALYQYGNIAIALHQIAIAREAWLQYMDRPIRNAAQRKEVEYKLKTELHR